MHLCDWPIAETDGIDLKLREEMGLVREIVSVGRSARTASKIKVRQPLSRVEILLADHRLDGVVKQYQELIADELNVHAAEIAERADDYVTFAVKPDLKKLGPRLGKRLPALKKSLSEVEGVTIRNALVEQGTFSIPLDGEPFPLSTDDVLVEVAAKPGYAAAESRRVVVVLATLITEALKREGYAREIVHAVQGMRRDLDLAFDARIRLGIQVPAALESVLEEHGEYIAHETLAVELSNSAFSPAAKSETIEIDSLAVTITLCASDLELNE